MNRSVLLQKVFLVVIVALVLYALDIYGMLI